MQPFGFEFAPEPSYERRWALYHLNHARRCPAMCNPELRHWGTAGFVFASAAESAQHCTGRPLSAADIFLASKRSPQCVFFNSATRCWIERLLPNSRRVFENVVLYSISFAADG
jgi:hypothetical protein